MELLEAHAVDHSTQAVAGVISIQLPVLEPADSFHPERWAIVCHFMPVLMNPEIPPIPGMSPIDLLKWAGIPL